MDNIENSIRKGKDLSKEARLELRIKVLFYLCIMFIVVLFISSGFFWYFDNKKDNEINTLISSNVSLTNNMKRLESKLFWQNDVLKESENNLKLAEIALGSTCIVSSDFNNVIRYVEKVYK